ncbi:MAG: MBL fold metallo-hydrolase [Oligoflexales bacterium]|nr:MBL fold metallo-hydrolase [Oligoflexales bacterium]
MAKMDGPVIHKILGAFETLFLVEYPDRLLLLDGGCLTDTNQIIYFITKILNRKMEDLKLAVVSHAHPDHAGAALKLRKLYKTEIAAHEFIDLWYSGIGGFTQHLMDIGFAQYVIFKFHHRIKHLWYSRKINPDHKLRDNDPLPYFDDWKVLHMPGHTANDIVIYNEKLSLAYIGDLIIRMIGIYYPPIPVTNSSAYKKTIDRLSKMKIDKLLLAHGGVVQNTDISKVVLSVLPKIKKMGKLNALKPFMRFNKASRRPRKNTRK